MIWIVSKYASLPKYGPASRLFFLAKYFNKQKKSILITSDSNHLAEYPFTKKRHNKEIIENVEVHWIKTFKYRKSFSIQRIISWIDFEIGLFTLNRKLKTKPEIIIISSLSLFSIIFGYYMKIKYKSFLVFEIRDIWPLTLISEAKYNKYNPAVIFLGLIEKFGYKNSDLVVGTMPKLGKHIKNVLGYNKEFFFSPIGFENNELKKSKNLPINIKKKFPKNKIIIGYAGSFSISNSINILLETIKLFSKNNKIHFITVGSGDYKQTFIKECKNLNNVTILNHLPYSLVQSFLKSCDILFLSTSDTEIWRYGQSMNKLLEYMLSAKPVIALFSGYPSMLNEANSGTFIKNYKPTAVELEILKYANLTKKQRSAIGSRGRKWIIKNRSYEKLAIEYLEKIKTLYKRKNAKKIF